MVATVGADSVDIKLGNSDGSYYLKPFDIYMAGVQNNTITVDFSDVNGYETKTLSDFEVYPGTFSLHNQTGWWGGNISRAKSSYNATTGILTIKHSGSVSQNYPIGITCAGCALMKL